MADQTDQLVDTINYLGHPAEVAFRGAAGGPGSGAGGVPAPSATPTGQTPLTQAGPQFYDQLFTGGPGGPGATGSPGFTGGAGQSFDPTVTGFSMPGFVSGAKQGLTGQALNSLFGMLGLDPTINIGPLSLNPVNLAAKFGLSFFGLPAQVLNTLFGGLLGSAKDVTINEAILSNLANLSPLDISQFDIQSPEDVTDVTADVGIGLGTPGDVSDSSSSDSGGGGIGSAGEGF